MGYDILKYAIRIIPCAALICLGISLIDKDKVYYDLLGFLVIWVSHSWYSYREKIEKK